MLSGKVITDNSLNYLKGLESNSISMVLTSPPYDNLRSYKGHSDFPFEEIAQELSRVLKDGGVIIWVVNDAVIKGSESGTSFRQALYFKDECGLNLHDTMIYRKANYMPQNRKRYEQSWEYMFCFTKGKIETFNPIKVPCKYAGTHTFSDVSVYDKDTLKKHKGYVIKDTKVHENIFTYSVGSLTVSKNYKHPAQFPLKLAEDMVSSFSNEGDTVLDIFVGSGTTLDACMTLNRNFIGIDINKEYADMAYNRCISHLNSTNYNITR